MSWPLLSIVIPTRNRSSCAISAIKSVLEISSGALELVVQDNSEDSILENYVRANFLDPRLQYNHTWERLDVIANFCRALEHSTGEYFTFIGDDDGVNPEILEATLWAKAHAIDALTPANVAGYFWPDLRQKYYGTTNASKLTIRSFSGLIRIKDAGEVEAGMYDSVRTGCQNLVNSTDIPKIYYGLVKRECIEQVRLKTGTYLPGISPDLAGAMAVANCVKRMATVDYPLYLPGSSASSTAGSGAAKKHVGRLEEQAHLPFGCWEKWSDVVPAFYAVQTVWAQSGWSALKAMGRDDILGEFNFPRLHALCIVFNPGHSMVTLRSLFKAARASRRSCVKVAYGFGIGYVYAWWTRFDSMFVRLTARWRNAEVVTISGLENIEQAVDALSRHLRRLRRSFSLCKLGE